MKSLLLNTTLLICLGVVLFYSNSKNNVCKTFGDYYSNRDANPNCYYNPEYNLITPEIIRRQGFKAETHKVITEDGYILTLFRIPPRKGAHGRPVFLQHGYASNSKIFVLTGKKSLAFILSNHGYDIWLGNSRGTQYSINHVSANISEDTYWNFSFDELGIYDLPAALGYIKNKTKQKIIYIGHSLGTVMMYIYGLSYPEDAHNQVSLFINLAPSVFLNNYGMGLHFAISNWNYIEPLLQIISTTKHYWSPLMFPLAKTLCFPFPFQMKSCMLPLMVFFGFNYGQHDPETLPMVLMQTPESASIKLFTHGVQLARSGKLVRFDYGNETNLKLYGSKQPPIYDFSFMKVPVYLVRAKNDKVVTPENVDALYNALPKEVSRYGVYEVNDKEFSHVDFVIGKDVVELVYNHIVKILKTVRNQEV